MLAFGLVAAGCSGSDEGEKKDATARTLIVAATATPGGFDGDALGQNTQNVVVQMNEPLLGFAVKAAADGYAPAADPTKIEGRLAERWEAAPDGRSYTITLRQGVKSAYGNELTSADVKWSWDKAFAQERTGNFIAKAVNVKAVETVDKYVVRFDLSAPSAIFLAALAGYVPGIYDSTEMKKHATAADPWALEWLKTNHAGFGPYTVDSLNSGEQAVFRANPNYYRGTPAYQRVVYRAVPESSNRVQLVTGGQVDLMEDVPLERVADLEGNDAVRVEKSVGTQHVRILMRPDTKPFDDIRVRQAIAWATPYQQVIDTVFQGRAEVSRSPVAPPYTCYTDAHSSGRTDPARARQLLAEAGYPNGLTLDFTYSDLYFWEEGVAIQTQAAMREAGIELKLVKVPGSTMATNIEEKKVGFFTGGIDSIIADGGYEMRLAAHSEGVGNDNGYHNPEVDRLVDQANASTDAAQRCQLLDQAQKIQINDAALVNGWIPTRYDVMKSAVTGFVWNPDLNPRWSDLKPA